MSFLVPAIISAGSSLLASRSSKKAAKAAQNAPQVDLTALNNLINQQSESNARRSLALEQELTPENAALRRTATNNLLTRAQNGDRFSDEAMQSVLAQLRSISETPARATPTTNDMRSRLFEDTVTAARDDLARGGQLDTETRNQVTRRAAANAARVGGGRLGLTRFLAPRDLGLTSMQVRNDRLNRAGQIGAQDADYNRSRVTTAETFRQNADQFRSSLGAQLAQLLGSLSNQRYGQDVATAGLAQSLTPPTVGLDPASAANVAVGNQMNRYQGQQDAIRLNNAANQNTLQGLGALLSIFNKQPA